MAVRKNETFAPVTMWGDGATCTAYLARLDGPARTAQTALG